VSPSDRFAATVGADHTLRVWSLPDLVQRLPDMPVRWTNAYTWCYCLPVSYAPVAWSPDETLLATPDPSGDVVIRRACDGQILATLPRPPRADGGALPLGAPDQEGPIEIAFAPDGGGLAVMFDTQLAYY